jgi:hypothetical protein
MTVVRDTLVGRRGTRGLHVIGILCKSEHYEATVPILGFLNDFMAVVIIGSIVFFGFRCIFLLQIIGTDYKMIRVSWTELDAARWEV